MLFLMFVSLAIPSYSIAQVSTITTINNNTSLNKEEYNSLTINGRLRFTDLSIANTIIINGSIEGQNLKCNTLQVNGQTSIDQLEAKEIKNNGSFNGKNITITGNTEINGSIAITNGKLNTIHAAAIKAVFISSEITGDVIVKKAQRYWRFLGATEPPPQILELKEKSIILGDIIFQDHGEVHLFDASQVKGKVFNGKVVQK